jgi:hypothetical protein
MPGLLRACRRRRQCPPRRGRGGEHAGLERPVLAPRDLLRDGVGASLEDRRREPEQVLEEALEQAADQPADERPEEVLHMEALREDPRQGVQQARVDDHDHQTVGDEDQRQHDDLDQRLEEGVENPEDGADQEPREDAVVAGEEDVRHQDRREGERQRVREET